MVWDIEHFHNIPVWIASDCSPCDCNNLLALFICGDKVKTTRMNSGKARKRPRWNSTEKRAFTHQR
jgi:hypothetical protein